MNVYALDTSDRLPSYVLDCDSGAQLRLSALAGRVLEAQRSGATFEEIATACTTSERTLTANDARRLHEHVMARVEIAEQRRRSRWSDHGVLLRFTLMPSVLVGKVAAPFAALFQRQVAIAAMLFICGAAAYGFATQKLAWPEETVTDILAGYGLFLVSCLAHELGHAGACMRFGVRPGPIGVLLYLVFPAFFSDVTRIWRLNRTQRVVVDVAGIYLQSLCAAVYVLIYVQTHAAACFLAIALILAALLLDVNPLFRFDGYWIVSDALGIRGLSAHVGLSLRRCVQRLAGAEPAAAPSWSKATVAAVSLYSLIGLAYWAWFAGTLLARTLAQGRWTFAALAALAKHEQQLSLPFAVRLAPVLAGGFALAYCLIALIRFVREALRDSSRPVSRAER
jgi:putative peptide zinc metalloprotease protein